MVVLVVAGMVHRNTVTNHSPAYQQRALTCSPEHVLDPRWHGVGKE